MDILPFNDANNHGIGGNQDELRSRVSGRICGYGALKIVALGCLIIPLSGHPGLGRR
jgi:hypothetical protein